MVKGWTIDTAITHILALRDADILRTEQRFSAQEKAVQAALTAAHAATDKVAIATERRFESVNEFRGNLKDQQSSFVTRNEIYALIGVAGVVGGLIGHFLK